MMFLFPTRNTKFIYSLPLAIQNNGLFTALNSINNTKNIRFFSNTNGSDCEIKITFTYKDNYHNLSRDFSTILSPYYEDNYNYDLDLIIMDNIHLDHYNIDENSNFNIDIINLVKNTLEYVTENYMESPIDVKIIIYLTRSSRGEEVINKDIDNTQSSKDDGYLNINSFPYQHDLHYIEAQLYKLLLPYFNDQMCYECKLVAKGSLSLLTQLKVYYIDDTAHIDKDIPALAMIIFKNSTSWAKDCKEILLYVDIIKGVNKAIPLKSNIKDLSNKRFYSTTNRKLNNDNSFVNINDNTIDIEKNLISSRKAINLLYILNSSDSLEIKQMNIENYFNNEYDNTLIKDLSNFNNVQSNNIQTILLKSYKSCEKVLNTYKNSIYLIKNKCYKDIIIKTPSEILYSIVVTNVIPNILKNDCLNDQQITMLCERIGKKLVRGYFYYEYLKYKEWETSLKDSFNNSDRYIFNDELFIIKGLSYIEFKQLLPLNLLELKDLDYIKYGYDMIDIISNNSKLYNINLEYDSINKKSSRYMNLDINAKNILLDYMSDDINTTPMICKPNSWEIEITNDKGDYNITKYGGYLLNEKEHHSFIHKNYKNVGFNKFKDNGLINTINILQNIEFQINKDVLEIIIKCINDHSLNDILPVTYHPLTNSIKDLKKDKELALINNILKRNSIVYSNINILTNALILQKIESIFIPIFIDWRGRLYSRTASFSYQGGDLSKSLFIFKNGCILNDNGLIKLKLYIASCYALSKSKSNVSLLEWVESNINNIIDIESKFWLQGKKPLQALAASLELKKYMNCENKTNFHSYLPIYIDATCNGLQHLTSMAGDITLAKHVNLLKSSDFDIPNDLYSVMGDRVKQDILDYIADNPDKAILDKLIINRNFIKRGIMTIPYGATIRGLRDQLINDHFELLKEKISNRYLYKVKDDFVEPGFNNLIKFTTSDITILAKIIHNILFKNHKSLTYIVNYFKGINSLLHEIRSVDGLVWIAPSGVIIEQKYVHFEQEVLYTNILGKRKSITLNKPILNKVNLMKQNLGILPNIIHSLDASNISLLVNNYMCNKDKPFTNILTIHDCFATNANDIDILTFYIKQSFISIYSNGKYLKEFHEHFIKTLKNNGFVITDNNKHICLNGKIYIDIPEIPKIGKLNFKELINSKYFVH